jgi:hypothetical protein
MNKKTLLVVLLAVSATSFLMAEELPFEKGDTIGFTTVKTDLSKINRAKVIDINGSWVLVDYKWGGTSGISWWNIDNLLEVWVVEKVKADTKK